ncbi:MAG: hypothetical protein ACYTXC_01315 [Nostoc sp.]
MKIKGFKEALAKAKKSVKEGKVISVDQLQRKYYLAEQDDNEATEELLKDKKNV